MDQPKLAQLCLLALIVLCIHGNSLADGPPGHPVTVAEKVDALAQEFCAKATFWDQYKTCRAIAEEMQALGVATEDRLLESRGLIRQVFCEIRYGNWGNSWKEKLKKCERICHQRSTLAYGELLMFRGHTGKWRPKMLDKAIIDARGAIVIGSQIQDDTLLAKAHNCLADLSLVEGFTLAARSHALNALTIAEHTGQQTILTQALYLIVTSFEHDRQPDLALPYAKRLLELQPERRVRNKFIKRYSNPEGLVERQREHLASLPKTGIKMTQHDRVGRAYAMLADSLMAVEETSEAADLYRQAGRHFKGAGNDTNYVGAIILCYKCCLDNQISIEDAEPFLEMLRQPKLTYSASNLADIIRILDWLGEPSLAELWQEKLRLSKSEIFRVEHDRAVATTAQSFKLELARRALGEEVERANEKTRQQEAKMRLDEIMLLKQQSADRAYRAILASAFGVLGVSLLGCFLVVNRRALKKLKKEIVVREATQAKNEELAQQILQTQKLDALGTLSAGIAHDFNNTLQAVTMLAEVVKDEVEPGSASHEHLNTILEAAEQGSTLTRSMLVFSGKHETIKSNHDLIAIVRETESMVKHMVPASVAISSDVVSSSPEVLVEMNPAQIKQLLLNLVINARDAMPDGGALRLRISEPEAKPGFVQLSVSDNGSGMSDEVKTKIFEPFFTTKDRGQGTGLGMPMTHGIIEDHGGTIEVESEVEVGTTVKIMLPRVVNDPVGKETPATVRVDAGERIVLLTDDNEHIRLGMKTKLEQLGYRVAEAHDGLAAVDVYVGMANKPDLILMDVDLPGLDGPRCVEALREKGATAPVIFITGLSSNELDAPVLAKPFTEEELVQAISEVQQAPKSNWRVKQVVGKPS